MSAAPPLRGVIFDYGNTLAMIDPRLGSRRADYADVVAMPGALGLDRHLRERGALRNEGSSGAGFVERFLGIRERNRRRADETCVEVTASASLVETLAALGEQELTEPERTEALAEFFTPEIEAIVPVEGAGETLNALAERGLRLALLSNATDAAYVAEAIRRLGWSRYFDPLVVSAALGVRKPRREAFDAVLSRWPLHASEVAMVGDSLYHDVQGARERGLFAVHLTALPAPIGRRDAIDAAPALVVDSHAALLRALLERAA
jgi:HAD superfamily hydrolase (TIGR01549 family)